MAKNPTSNMDDMKAVIAALSASKDILYIVVRGLRIQVDTIQSMKPRDEYNYIKRDFDPMIIINETSHNNASPNANIRIKFDSVGERNAELIRIDEAMKKVDIKFHE